VLAVTISGDMITAVHHHDFLSLFAILYLFLQFAVRVAGTCARLLGKFDRSANDDGRVGE
jgi:hypothetical protein